MWSVTTEKRSHEGCWDIALGVKGGEEERGQGTSLDTARIEKECSCKGGV